MGQINGFNTPNGGARKYHRHGLKFYKYWLVYFERHIAYNLVLWREFFYHNSYNDNN